MRRARAVRLASILLAMGLVAWALADDDLIGGGPGFGWTQALVLAAGLGLAACALLPIAWNQLAITVAISTAIALGVAEAGLRLLVAPRYYPPFQADELLLYSLVPGAAREYRRPAINGGDTILYRINSDGYRGEELARDGDAPRIVVFGDSFIQAEFSRLEDTFAERLELHLAERLGTTVEVVNAGVAGYGPDQIVRKMERELARLAPDLVVVAIFAGNDFGDLVRNKLYRLDEAGKLQENTCRLSPWLAEKLRVSRREAILKRIARESLRSLGAGSGDAGDVALPGRRDRMEAYLEQSRAEYREAVVMRDPVVRELLSDPYNADVSLTPYSESARYKAQMMDRVVARMNEVAERHAVPLVLVLIPHPIDTTDGHESGEVDPEKHPDYARSTLTDLLQRIAERHAVPYVDLFGPFWERRERPLYFRGLDDHWSDLGQDLAAETVADFLVSQGLLDDGGEAVRGVTRRAGPSAR